MPSLFYLFQVANLDFVESIFGNGGDPALPVNDAGLDTKHWTGTTGCVVLAPHLRQCLKKELGLPHISEATEKQKATGMCWTEPDELYNGGKPFKITMRDERGIMVTILADNYFGTSLLQLTRILPNALLFRTTTGYCKKEVKTQIGLTANIFGLAEEEHAGGALAFKATNLGEHFVPNPRYMQVIVPSTAVKNTYSFEEATKLLGDSVTIHPEGYATDKHYPHIHVMPEDVNISIPAQEATFTNPKTGEIQSIRILPNHVYVHPSGYKVRVAKHPSAPKWRLIGTLPEATCCHKPSTVSSL